MLMSTVIGHRGVASLAPENTLAGMRKAAELGVQWIELDVTLLGDNSAVMFHDDTLNRTTTGKGSLLKISLDQVQKLDAGSWHSESFSGEVVPTLVEALSLIKFLGLRLNLELKPNHCDLQALVNQTVNALGEVDFPSDHLLVSSFNHQALVLFVAQYRCPVGCLFEQLPKKWLEKAREVGAVSIHLNAQLISEDTVSDIKSKGYELYCYTVNRKEEAKVLLASGVDGVFSDCPQLLADLV